MKQKTGKKIGKILLLVALLAIVGGIVYAVLTWPMYPDPGKTWIATRSCGRIWKRRVCWSLRRTSCHGWKHSTVKSWMAGTG